MNITNDSINSQIIEFRYTNQKVHKWILITSDANDELLSRMKNKLMKSFILVVAIIDFFLENFLENFSVQLRDGRIGLKYKR